MVGAAGVGAGPASHAVATNNGKNPKVIVKHKKKRP
jgi:hypothetical protein